MIYIDEGLDTGDILLSEKIPLVKDETGGSLHDRLAGLAPVVIDEVLQAFESGAPSRKPQDASLATLSPKLGREDGRLDWSRDAALLERTIRAYDPWPGTTTRWSAPGAKPTSLKIFPPAVTGEPANAPAGTVTAATSPLCTLQIAAATPPATAATNDTVATIARTGDVGVTARRRSRRSPHQATPTANSGTTGAR